MHSHWEHPSNEDAVYLTTAYALHYASSEMQGRFAAILDLDPTALNPDHLVADEDSYALATVRGYEWLTKLPLAERVTYWREHLAETDAAESLRVLGNCAYLGSIPTSAVRGVRLLEKREVSRLVMGVSDPAISPANFKLLGGTNQRFSAWLVGRQKPEDEELTTWFERVCTPALPVMPLAEAVKQVGGR